MQGLRECAMYILHLFFAIVHFTTELSDWKRHKWSRGNASERHEFSFFQRRDWSCQVTESASLPALWDCFISASSVLLPRQSPIPWMSDMSRLLTYRNGESKTQLQAGMAQVTTSWAVVQPIVFCQLILIPPNQQKLNGSSSTKRFKSSGVTISLPS